tara:strand:+ start:1784 stop:2044 length:261 start_codon:yes stop_codon:yes gene_type:complete
MIREKEIQEVKALVRDHAEYCSKIWRVDFDYENYEPEVHTFYIRDHQVTGREELQFRHLVELEEAIQTKLGDRYKVGIVYHEIPSE